MKPLASEKQLEQIALLPDAKCPPGASAEEKCGDCGKPAAFIVHRKPLCLECWKKRRAA